MRFVDDSWEIKQRLVRLDVVERSVNAQQLAQVLHQCLFTCFQVEGQNVLAVIRDGAAVNGAALDCLRPFLPNMLEVVCFSHAMYNVGKHFQTPSLDEFGQLWVRLFSCSCRAKLQWKQQTGQTPKSYLETRWWSRWEMYEQLLTCFGDVRPFLDANQDVAPNITDCMREFMDDPEQLCRLKLELAAVIDVGKKFATSTYQLEGDGGLSLCCYEVLQAVATSCQMGVQHMHFPNVHAVAFMPTVAPSTLLQHTDAPCHQMQSAEHHRLTVETPSRGKMDERLGILRQKHKRASRVQTKSQTA